MMRGEPVVLLNDDVGSRAWEGQGWPIGNVGGGQAKWCCDE